MMRAYRSFLVGVLATTLTLSACTSTMQPQADPVVNIPATPLSTPTARVLTRTGQALPKAPPDLDEGPATDTTPDYGDVVRTLPKVGTVAPDFTLRTLDGVVRQEQSEMITLSKLRSHPVLINFWASWCLACRAEAPELQALYAEYKDRGLIVLGVNVTQQDTLADARAYVSGFGLTFPVLMDEQGDAGKAYGVVGLPTSFFIDSKGVVRDVVIGQLSRAAMRAGLKLTKPW